MAGTQRLGVALATFNGAEFLAEQLQSIMAQTRLPDEIVVSDDHSTDGTREIVAETIAAACEESGIELRIITNPTPRGPAANFANALAHSTADVVALADQDDVWLPTKLDNLVAYFDAKPDVLMVHSDATLVDRSGQPLGLSVLDSLRTTSGEKRNLLTGHGIRALVRRNLVTGQTALVRRSLVDQAGPIPEGFVHDEWWALVAASSRGLVFDPGVFQLYRQHGGNQIGAQKSGLARLRERFGEPQQVFRARHQVRHEGLAAYMDSPLWSGTPEARGLLRGRIDHYAWQAGLPASRIARFLPIVAMLLTGAYHRYRRGVFDALRDLLQPASSS